MVLAGIFSKSDALATIFNLAQAVLMVLLFYNKAKSYGKGGGFTAGLVLLNIIFEGILALGPVEYQGNASQGIAFVDQGIDKVKELFGGKKEERSAFPSARPVLGLPVEKNRRRERVPAGIFHPQARFSAFRLKRRCGTPIAKDRNSILRPLKRPSGWNFLFWPKVRSS